MYSDDLSLSFKDNENFSSDFFKKLEIQFRKRLMKQKYIKNVASLWDWGGDEETLRVYGFLYSD